MDITLTQITLLVIIFILGIVVITQRKRINKLSIKFGESHEMSIELQKAIKDEVQKTNITRLIALSQMDKEIIPLWETTNYITKENSEKWLKTIAVKASDLEREWSKSEGSEKADIALTLREVYWLWLERARSHWASGEGYQSVRKHINEMLNEFQKQKL